MKTKIRLVALDMDGTLYNNQSKISKADQNTIRKAVECGITVIISTGRPYVGLPVETLSAIGIRYAITSNGAAIYRLPDKECIYSDCMPPELVCPIIKELQKKDIHMDAFIDGNSISQLSCKPNIDRLDMPASIRNYIKATRAFTKNLAEYIEVNHLYVQKMTLNFYPLSDGTFKHREETISLLAKRHEITFLSGGYHNLEFTGAKTTKGSGLFHLCEILGIAAEETMACGDTENDIAILKAAGTAVVMANASDEIKSLADFITLSNEESGVSHAIRHFLPEIF